jgi:hypothetical protein
MVSKFNVLWEWSPPLGLSILIPEAAVLTHSTLELVSPTFVDFLPSWSRGAQKLYLAVAPIAVQLRRGLLWALGSFQGRARWRCVSSILNIMRTIMDLLQGQVSLPHYIP